MAAPHEIASAIAAVLAALVAVAGAFVAARSARASEQASEIALQAERRSALRDTSAQASMVLEEYLRYANVAAELNRLITRASTRFEGPEQVMLGRAQLALEQLQNEVTSLRQDAGKFADGSRSLRESPLDDIDRVRLRMMESAGRIRVAREQLAGWSEKLSKT